MLDVSSYPATVAELVDAQDLGSCGATRGGSSPSGRIRTCRIGTRRCRKNALALQRRTRHLEGDPMDQTFQELRLAWARLRLEADCAEARGIASRDSRPRTFSSTCSTARSPYRGTCSTCSSAGPTAGRSSRG